MSLRDSPYLPPKINTNFMHNSDPNFSPTTDDPLTNFSGYDSNRLSGESSPILMSPWFNKGMDNSNHHMNETQQATQFDGLVGSLYREEGHIYSLACSGDLLYTGSGSKNIRVWRNLNEFAAFKSNSGLVKAIVLSGDKVFTGHQDGKIRIWKKSTKDPTNHKRVGTFPTSLDILKSSIKPNSYVEVRRKCSTLWIKHCDAISCLSIQEHEGLLYSCSWDRTFKVWDTSRWKCLESVKAHDDAVNAIVGAGSGLVLTGSADGCVKVWRRKWDGKVTKHSYVETLLDQECAVTALAVSEAGLFVYCGLSDGLVHFWLREKETMLRGGALKGHKLAVLCLRAAGKLVFSGSADKTICVWKRGGQGNNNVHSRLSVLTGHEGPVKCLAVERGEGKWVVYSGSLDKSVKVWSVSE